RADEPGQDHPVVDDVRIDDALAHRLGDLHAETEGGHEVEEGGPHYGLQRREHAGGDDGGDRVGGVVKAVDEVEDQGDQNDEDDEGKHRGPASGHLQDDPFDHVGDVLTAVGDDLHRLVDLFPLDDLDGIAGRLEHGGQAVAEKIVGAVFESIDL